MQGDRSASSVDPFEAGGARAVLPIYEDGADPQIRTMLAVALNYLKRR